MIWNIRQAELSLLGSGETESQFINGKRSLVSTIDLKPGDYLNKANTTTKRPCFDDSVPAIDYNDVLGERVYSPIPKDTIIKKSDLPAYYE